MHGGKKGPLKVRKRKQLPSKVPKDYLTSEVGPRPTGAPNPKKNATLKKFPTRGNVTTPGELRPEKKKGPGRVPSKKTALQGGKVSKNILSIGNNLFPKKRRTAPEEIKKSVFCVDTRGCYCSRKKGGVPQAV